MNIKSISEVLQLLNADMPIEQIKLIDGNQLKGKHVFLHSIDESALYEFSNLEPVLDLLGSLLNKEYAHSDLVWIEEHNDNWQTTAFKGNDSEKFLKDKNSGFLFIKAQHENASMIAFKELVAHLRAPEGCPWDQEQTHQSLKTNLLEETYEVLDAIDSGAPAELQEELGDLLLQIVLHAQIAAEAGDFDLSDVIQGIHHKITFRHPHVFKNLEVNGVKDIFRNWENLKSQERKKNGTEKESILDSIPKNLPALSLAQKYQERAARVGFDWTEIEPVLDKVQEEIEEFRAAGDKEAREAELGDLLFAIVNVVRWNELDAEGALRKMTKRFALRFKAIEKKAAASGRKMTDLTLTEMDEYWDLAKKEESQDQKADE